MFITSLFWILLALVVYSYLGYTVLLIIISGVIRTSNRLFRPKPKGSDTFQPEVTILVAAHNEEAHVEAKIMNTLGQDYPGDKVWQVWVDDGSTDRTREILATFDRITLLRQPERRGKVSAINLGMTAVRTPITIFSDANAMLAENAISKLIEPFRNPKVGCVAGEKRVLFEDADSASASGEGTYWQYESHIKRLESECGSTLSATGELYAIRTELFENLDKDIILDDFAISTHVIRQGYTVKYMAEACSVEKASASIDEEMKRKVRIAAGSFQILFRYPWLLFPVNRPMLVFQFLSHKLLRWCVLPVSLFLLPVLNVVILASYSQLWVYWLLLCCQLLLGAIAVLGWRLKNRPFPATYIFLPYYLVMMNVSIIKGFVRYLTGQQKVTWEKAVRRT
jgi:cellulose synthase/poly-beta-1,6-N-acetylglucosamine synthase-like glycosyltransferase